MNSFFPAHRHPDAIQPVGSPAQSGVWIVGAVLLLILALSSSQAITLAQLVGASLLLFIAIRAYLSWANTKSTKIPVWALVCFVHFIYYGLAIFSAARTSPSSFDNGANLEDSTLTSAMLVGIAGLLAMALGRKAVLSLGSARGARLRLIDIGGVTPLRIHAMLLAGIAANVLGVPIVNAALRNVMITIFTTLPLAAFLWVVLAASARKIEQLDFLLAVGFLVTRVVSGARFGASLTTIIVPVLLMGLGAISVNRRVPWRMLCAVACLVLFLQPSKGIVRGEMESGELTGNGLKIAMRWIEVAASGWADVFARRVPLESQIVSAASRSSLLTMTGVVLEMTPGIVPYQHGVSYPLLLQALIPRIFWADKPSVNVANQFFQVEYGLTDPENLSGVSIACGFEAEGYMNFGWLGVVGVGMLVGAAVGYYETVFFSPHTVMATTAVGLAILPGFLAIESQLVQYLGGIVQIVFAAMIVFHDAKAGRSSYGGANRIKAGGLPSAVAGD